LLYELDVHVLSVRYYLQCVNK